MSVAPDITVALQDRFFRDLPEMGVRWQAETFPDPRLLAFNEPLAGELGLDADWLRGPDGLRFLVGALVPERRRAGRAGLRGPSVRRLRPAARRRSRAAARRAHRRRRPAARHPPQGLGAHAVRPRRRRPGRGRARCCANTSISEAMHALGIPTTRSLAVVATGRPVQRETLLPGAVLTRVAASHLRVGSFQYAAAHRRSRPAAATGRPRDRAPLPRCREAEHPYLALFESVVAAQASLVAQWMLVGFIHGVMNTDNMTISGETIDYGPCAFMEAYDPATVFSSIDQWGRYAYGNQPRRRAVEPRPVRRGTAAAPRRHRRPGRRPRREGVRRLPRPVRRRRGRRHAGQARPAADVDAETVTAGRRRARTAPGESRRLHLVLPRPRPCRARRRRTRTRAVPRPRRLRRLDRALASIGRTPRSWTGAIPSTSRATISSRRRSPRRQRATSVRSSSCSPQ